MSRLSLVGVAVLVILALAGFWFYGGFQTSIRERLTLATTTSTYDSGLLDYLMPVFKSKYGIEVDILSKGTGEAIEIAKRGDADIVLVHSKKLEDAFVAEGYGVHRVGVMYNDFVIIGPSDDPAGVMGLTNATEAFSRITQAGSKGKAVFVSRADKSGTNMLELTIWNALGLKPSNPTVSWYVEAGAGMGTVLRMTNEKRGYTLADRATWLSFIHQLANLAVVVERDRILLNPYAVIPVNPERFPQRNFKAALILAKFLISAEGQTLLASFKKENQTLFFPLARDYRMAIGLGFPSQEREVAWYDAQDLPRAVGYLGPQMLEERKPLASPSWAPRGRSILESDR